MLPATDGFASVDLLTFLRLLGPLVLAPILTSGASGGRAGGWGGGGGGGGLGLLVLHISIPVRFVVVPQELPSLCCVLQLLHAEL